MDSARTRGSRWFSTAPPQPGACSARKTKPGGTGATAHAWRTRSNTLSEPIPPAGTPSRQGCDTAPPPDHARLDPPPSLHRCPEACPAARAPGPQPCFSASRGWTPLRTRRTRDAAGSLRTMGTPGPNPCDAATPRGPAGALCCPIPGSLVLMATLKNLLLPALLRPLPHRPTPP